MKLSFDEAKIDAIFAQLNQCHLPGAAVGIAIDGRPVYRKGFGLASMELPVVLSPSIRMPIGSTTKHFTCLAFMLLCEEGKARIDDTIGQYFPEFHPVVHGITMLQLMGHLGGLRDPYDIAMAFSGIHQETPAAQLLALYRDIDDLGTAPGTTWIYNNSGYLLLSAVIEKIAGQKLDDVFAERIFAPAGLHDTVLRRFDTNFLPNSVSLHLPSVKGGFEKGLRALEGVGQGGIYSTVDDMLRWLAHMDAPAVGSAATWKRMRTPQMLSNGASSGYGLGLAMGRYRGVETLQHAGGVIGGNSQMLKVPAANLAVAVMVNRHDVSGTLLVYKVLDACLPQLESIPEPSTKPLATGLYRSPTTGRVVQLFARGEQQIALVDGLEFPVAPDAEGALRPLPVGNTEGQSITVSGDPKAPTSIQFRAYGSLDELLAVTPAQGLDAGAIAGRYRSKATGNEVTISAEGRLDSTGRFGSTAYRLESLAQGIWLAKSLSSMPSRGMLSFEANGGGFRYSNGRTRGLAFQRG